MIEERLASDGGLCRAPGLGQLTQLAISLRWKSERYHGADNYSVNQTAQGETRHAADGADGRIDAARDELNRACGEVGGIHSPIHASYLKPAAQLWHTGHFL